MLNRKLLAADLRAVIERWNAYAASGLTFQVSGKPLVPRESATHTTIISEFAAGGRKGLFIKVSEETSCITLRFSQAAADSLIETQKSIDAVNRALDACRHEAVSSEQAARDSKLEALAAVRRSLNQLEEQIRDGQDGDLEAAHAAFANLGKIINH